VADQNTKPAYGGQALIEGVMFGGRHTSVTAIRRIDNSIDFYEVPKKKRPALQKLKKIPFIRGVVAIVEASGNGTKHLNFSSDRYEVHPDDDHTIETAEQSSKITMILGVAAIGIISFLFSTLIFTAVPAAIAEFFRPVFPGHVAQNLIEGVIKLIFLLTYIYLISMTPLIKRVFQYHGAEHKVINTFENGKELTVENVQAHSRLHFRCGSSYILLTVIVGVFLYLAVPSDPLWERLLYRILLIPVVLGASYEVLQLTNKVREIPFLKWLGYPGLWLQLLTTKEPKNDQVEVAIASFNELKKREDEFENPPAEGRIV
jgi:uncharacterized protein YqhQ